MASVSIENVSKQIKATPAFWKVNGPNGNLYLLGSLHYLPVDCIWYSQTLAEPLGTAIAYIGEVADFTELNAYNLEQGQPGGICFSETPLCDLLDRKFYNLFSEIMEHFGISQKEWQYYKPWYAANVLIANLCGTGGYLSNYGVEAALDPIVKQMGKNSFGLENPEFQLNIFDKLSVDTQVQHLQNIISQRTQFLSIFQILYDGWRRADINSLLNNVLLPTMELSEYYDALFTRRHPSWIRKLEQFLQIPGDYFLVAGVLHFIGPNNILELLEKRGYSITRIQ